MANRKKWQFWIDRGGTFTDVIARRPDGNFITKKILSQNPKYYQDAAIYGIRQILQLDNVTPIPTNLIDAVKMGTTVATNALLEHQGEPTVLVITKGFADALQIGYQNRPDIFAREIVLPKLIYDRVIAVEERVNVNGDILIPLNLTILESDLRKAYQQGFRSIAIVLMHAYRYTEHEQAIAALAAQIGFTQISISHRVSPLMKLVSRGDTTVVDAYLSPKLKKYIDQVATELGETKLLFMQSNGGLARADAFHGKDSILSGPAAGIIGAIATSLDAGFERIISFDMGGTSTDVAHYSGELERSQLSIIAGIRLRSPMLQIDTIAAGGGSILKFKQGRFQVGPESAGADPGPACYRHGGPLTLTDCNVLLGRIQPEYFPKSFGENAQQPLDHSIVVKKFNRLAEQIAAEIQEKQSPYLIAEGFLKVAVTNMANAIKKISIQRGYDVTKYTLCCFGGAGGQHACAVADELGIETIMIHPLAGVLSAYGLGLAEYRLLKEQAIERDLMTVSLGEVESILTQLAEAGRRALLKQGVAKERIRSQQKLRLRYQGSDTSLEVTFATVQDMQNEFEKKHGHEFGYIMTDKIITIESALVELIGITKKLATKKLSSQSSLKKHTLSYVTLYFQGKPVKTHLYHRDALPPGTKIAGPALIIEENSTTFVDQQWQATISAEHNLLLKRIKRLAPQAGVSKKADPVMLEVFNNLFMSIADQMGTVLAKTAYSVNIKERLDFSCALFNKQGHLIANAHHIPVHLGSMSDSIQTIIRERKNNMHHGDVYLLNNPYNGGTHLPDVTAITPVFLEKETQPIFFVASRAHHADIGGITPGSIPAESQYIEEEGILIDNFLLVEKGHFREAALLDLLTNAKWPARNPAQNIADLQAQIAANQKGVQELLRIIEQFGFEVVAAYMQHIQDNAERCVRDVIDRLHNGHFEYAMDNGAIIRVAVAVNTKNHTATIDFSGTSFPQKNNFNAPKAVCYAAVLYVFRTLVDEAIPMNQGCLKPLNIIIPEDCMLNPKYPAAIVAGNVETSQCIVDTLYGALNIMAASQGTMNNFTFGNDQYQYYETICGGSGAGPGFNGTSAVHTHMTNSLLTDPEILELRFPILVEDFCIRAESGGKGQWYGGNGVVRKIKFLEKMQAAIVSNRRQIPPYGMAGGQPAALGENWIERVDGQHENLAATVQFQVNAGDVVVISTPGGGGYGIKK